jgi:NAD(P)-dependent dehydrogenase (short-subunit alcohol dehydrogenase family)
MTKLLQNKVALVTGASRGLGYATALHLAAAGVHVIAVARTQGGLEALDDAIKSKGGSATLVPLDLSDSPAIDRLGAAIFERWKKLDVLVGNAGVLGKITPVAHLEPKDWASTFDINVTANYRLIRSMDLLLRQSEAGRAVFVTSGQSYKCNPFWGAYSVTKAALEALVKTYAAEIATTSVRANMFSPGPTRTKMRATSMPGEDPMTLPSPDEVAAQLIPMCAASFSDNGGVWKYDQKGLFKQF